MNISLNRKGSRLYARFRDKGMEVYLGGRRDECIRTLQRTWHQHNFHERCTQDQLDKLIQTIKDNMKI